MRWANAVEAEFLTNFKIGASGFSMYEVRWFIYVSLKSALIADTSLP